MRRRKIIENMLSVILVQGICLRQIRAFCLRFTPTARFIPIAWSLLAGHCWGLSCRHRRHRRGRHRCICCSWCHGPISPWLSWDWNVSWLGSWETLRLQQDAERRGLIWDWNVSCLCWLSWDWNVSWLGSWKTLRLQQDAERRGSPTGAELKLKCKLVRLA